METLIPSGTVKNKVINFEMGNPGGSIDATSVPLPRDLKEDTYGDQMTTHHLLSRPAKNKAKCLEPARGTLGLSVDNYFPTATDVDLRRDQ